MDENPELPSDSMNVGRTEPERHGVGGGVAALLAIATLVVGLASGLIVGGTGGYLLGRSDGHLDAVGPVADSQPIDSLLAPEPPPSPAQALAPLVETPAADRRARAQAPSASVPQSPQSPQSTPPSAYPGPGEEPGAAEMVRRPYIGVVVETVAPQAADDTTGGAQSGARISFVEPDSPAAAVGLQVDDVIVAVGDTPVTSADDLVAAISAMAIGNTVTLHVLRGDLESSLEVTLGGRTDAEIPMQFDGNMPGMPGDQIFPLDPNDPELQTLLDQLPPEVRAWWEEMLKQMPENMGPTPEPTRDSNPEG